MFTNGWPEFSAVICCYSPVEEWVSLRLPHTRELVKGDMGTVGKLNSGNLGSQLMPTLFDNIVMHLCTG